MDPSTSRPGALLHLVPRNGVDSIPGLTTLTPEHQTEERVHIRLRLPEPLAELGTGMYGL